MPAPTRPRPAGGTVPLDDHYTADTLDLRDYLAVLRRRKWVILLTVLVVVGVALGVTYTQTPQYRSSVRVIVESTTGDTSNDVMRQIVFGQQELETQKELVTSRPVAEKAAEKVGGGTTPDQLLKHVNVSLVRDTQILEIQATSPDAQRAANIASGFANAYIDYRSDQALEQLLRGSKALQERADETRRRISEIEREIGISSSSDAESLQIEKERLQNELAGIGAQQAALSGNQVFAQAGGQIISPAEVAESPFSPKPLRTGVLAFVLGLMLGVGLAFLRDFLDDSLRSEDQAVRAAGRPALGHIPHWKTDKESESRLVSLVEPASPASESYRTLRTNIRFLAVGRSLRSLLVTSAVPREGKSTTAANLAVALARTGTRVLLVGADLRRPSLHTSFGIDASPGLSDVLAGDVQLTDAISDVGIPNLRVLTSGQVPPNPAELLGSPAMAQLMSELEQVADLVVYDGPPVLAVADALELAPRVGGSLLVVDLGTTGRHAVRAAAQRLEGVGVVPSGIVLNNITPGSGYYGYYHTYYHDYSSEEPASIR